MKPVSTILAKRSTSAIDTQMERETPQNKFVAKYSQSLWKHKITYGSRSSKCNYLGLLFLENGYKEWALF